MKNLSESDLARVGRRIKLARKKLGKSQEEISEIAGISAQYWSAVEVGRDRGSMDTYLKVTAALGITLNDLFYDKAELIQKTPPKFLADVLDGLNEYEQSVLANATLSLRATIIHARKLL